MTTLRTVAVVMAGGTGTRVGAAIPKQLITIAGRPIIEHTIAALQASPSVDEIVVMMTPGHVEDVWTIVRRAGLGKVTQVLEGAGTRSDTAVAALAALGDEDCNVLLHDAVRPLVSQTIIEANVAALATYEAVNTAVPSTDTMIQVDDTGRISDVLPRHLLRRVQTPQSFRLSTLRAAYAKALRDPDFTATDDCTVVLRYSPEVEVVVVPGHGQNIKITEPIDVRLAELLLQTATPSGS